MTKFCKVNPFICQDILISGRRNKKQTDDSNTQFSDKQFLSANFRTVTNAERRDELFTQTEADEIIQNVRIFEKGI